MNAIPTIQLAPSITTQKRSKHLFRISNAAKTPNPCICILTSHSTSTSLSTLMFLTLLPTLLELLRLFVCFLNRLTNLALLLACLDGYSDVSTFTGGFANGAFGIFPVGCSGADFVSVM